MLIQEIVKDPDLPVKSYEFRRSIARPRDTLIALHLLRIALHLFRGKVDRSLLP